MPVCGFTKRDCRSKDCLFQADNSCFGCANEQVLILYKGVCPDYPDREYSSSTEIHKTDNNNGDVSVTNGGTSAASDYIRYLLNPTAQFMRLVK
jgi:hypothetical protein